MRRVLTTLAILLAGVATARAQQTRPAQQVDAGTTLSVAAGSAARVVRAVRISDRITLDGRLDEAAWGRATVAEGFTQLRPRDGAPASTATHARVLYDDDALYIGVQMDDPAPDSIVGRVARRDDAVYSDWVYIILDTYHDRQNAYLFGVNAGGTRYDARVSSDASIDASWDGVWDAAVHRSTTGWTAELRIPFSQLRYNAAGNGPSEWGINFERQLARRVETSYWAPVPASSSALVSLSGRLVGLEQLRAPAGFELSPYVAGRLDREPPQAGNPFVTSNDWSGKVGADARWRLPSGPTLAATVNPDFGQVEADPSVVNLTAYETFFPEKRPFFIEGSEAFKFPGAQAFYSRRIGRAPEAEAPSNIAATPDVTTILGATRVTGRTESGWSLGFLDAVTGDESLRYQTDSGTIRVAQVEPLTNYGVARVTRDLGNGATTLGGMFTRVDRRLDDSRLDFLRSNATTFGIDGRHRLGGNRFEISANVLGSHIEGDTTAIQRVQLSAGHYFQRPDARNLHYDPTRTSLDGVSAGATIRNIGGGHWIWSSNANVVTPGFEVNDMGFQATNDRVTHGSSLMFAQNTPQGPLQRWNVGTQYSTMYTTGGERMELNGTVNASLTTRGNWYAGMFLMRHTPGVSPDALRGGPSVYEPGHYMLDLQLMSDTRSAVVAMFDWYWEPHDNGTLDLHTYSANLDFHPSTRLTASVNASLLTQHSEWQYVTAAKTAAGNAYIVSGIEQRTLDLSMRLDYAFTPSMSLQLYGEPFVGAGAYSRFRRLGDAHSPDLDRRFPLLTAAQLGASTAADGSTRYAIDANGDGSVDLTMSDPSFNVKQFHSNAVFRWEYRSGSVAYIVWGQQRSAFTAANGSFSAARDLANLFGAQGGNVLAIKWSYWIGR